ncbi:MAG: hypothetical protein ACFE8U_05630 [Candidatus Hermodarchaeota archaeon]
MEAYELFKRGQLREALQETTQETKKSNNVKLLKALILYYNGQFKYALQLVDNLLTGNNLELLMSLKPRL